jgi:hypothetical protein
MSRHVNGRVFSQTRHGGRNDDICPLALFCLVDGAAKLESSVSVFIIDISSVKNIVCIYKALIPIVDVFMVFNATIYKGQLLIKGTFSGSREYFLYTGLTVIFFSLNILS